MLQFSDISGPWIVPQFLLGAGVDSEPLFVIFRRIPRQKHFGERQDIFFSFAQRRDLDMNRIDPVQQVFAELLLRHHFRQVSIRRADQADVGRDRQVASDPDDAATLDGRQQFRLQMVR